jgi:hypothetical protein
MAKLSHYDARPAHIANRATSGALGRMRAG